jgi:hypothetical protein
VVNKYTGADAMKEGGIGGGNTITGLKFEGQVDIATLFSKIEGYELQEAKIGINVLFKNELVARIFKKNSFYVFLKEEHQINWKNFLSCKLIPDNAILVIIRETLFIIEVKFQKVEGSVDEKLQTCDFKRKQYAKIVKPLGLKVEYVYVLNDWFKKTKYRDVLDYIESMNCHYKFNELPLAWLGLPTP